MKVKLLVSPMAQGAYFNDCQAVALAELGACLPGLDGAWERRGPLDFISCEADEDQLLQLARLSFVQGIFRDEGERLAVLDQGPEFQLPAELVYGLKYQGKTNELVTQLAINIALRMVRVGRGEVVQLLDPLAGRGTTLLWALRYGMNARGIEQSVSALESFHQHIKKQTKIHRIKHQMTRGFVGKSNRRGIGRYSEVRMGEHILRLIVGDSRNAGEWLQNKRFHLVVADLPYGVQHVSEGARGVERNPERMVEAAAPGWVEHLRRDGAMVLIFNEYQPGRERLEKIFVDLGLTAQPFRAPHRMSESIVRDLILFTKGRG